MKALIDRPLGIRLILGIMALLLAAGAFALGAAGSARADDTPSPTPTPSASTAAQTVEIWVRVASDKSPVANVSVKVTGPKGYSQTFITGPDGKALVGIPKAGNYKVALDASTLPQKSLKAAINPLTVTVATGDVEDPAYFLLVPGNSGGSGGASPSPGSGGGSGGHSIDYFALTANLVANGIIFGLLLALASIGVSLIYGTTGLNNFAHGELVTFGALSGYVLSSVLHLPIWVAITGGFVLGGVFGYVQDMAIWKPLRRKGVPLIPLMIVSIGLSLALRYLYEFIFGADQLPLSSNTKSVLSLGPVNFKQTDLVSIVICIVLLLAVAFVLMRTKIGKATRAVSDNKALAAASGINVERVIRIVWAGSGALAGLAGVLIGYYQTLRWDTGASILLLIFAAVTLGGFGTAFGALVGALIIGLLVNLSTLVLPANLQNAAALLVMILILLVRPQGIFGKRERIG